MKEKENGGLGLRKTQSAETQWTAGLRADQTFQESKGASANTAKPTRAARLKTSTLTVLILMRRGYQR
jgi:hypothetical protein